MFKYHEELDTDFYLPIVGHVDYSIFGNENISLDFFDKYETLFNIIKDLYNTLHDLDINNSNIEKNG